MQEINSQTKLQSLYERMHTYSTRVLYAANLPVTAYCTIIHFYKYVVLLHDLTDKQMALKEKDFFMSLEFKIQLLHVRTAHKELDKSH